jgi:hypothetical protein
LLLEEGDDQVGGGWFGKQEALGEGAVELVQYRGLFDGLDSLGDGYQAERAGQVEDCSDHCLAFGGSGDSVNEGFVDLEDVDGEVVEVRQR